MNSDERRITLDRPSTRRVWPASVPAALALMVPLDLLASLAMDVYLPVVAMMPAQLQTSSAVIQLTLSVYLLILGLGQLLFGPLSDRIGRRAVVNAGVLVFTLASLGLALSSSGGMFLLLRVGQAFGASAALVATFATVRDVYGDSPESSYIYGLFSSILAFVPALGPVLGALVAQVFGWRGIFLLLAGLGLVALLRTWACWQETRVQRSRPQGQPWRGVLASTDFRIYTLGFSTAMGAFFVFFSISPRLLMAHAGLDQVAFSLAFATVALVMIATARFARHYVACWGRAGCFYRGNGLIAVGALSIGVATEFLGFNLFTVILPMWVVAVGIVVLVSVTANGALTGFDHVAGTAVALYYALQSLIVSGLGTLCILAFDGDSAWPLTLYATVLAVSGMLALCCHSRRAAA